MTSDTLSEGSGPWGVENQTSFDLIAMLPIGSGLRLRRCRR